MELVEIIQPFTKERIFANISTGECFWEPPTGCYIKGWNAYHWWELFDINTSRFYYYNPASERTVWKVPYGAEIIQLSKLQMLDIPCNVTPTRPAMKDVAIQTPSSNKLDIDDQFPVKANLVRDAVPPVTHQNHSDHSHSLNDRGQNSVVLNIRQGEEIDSSCSYSLPVGQECPPSECSGLSSAPIPSTDIENVKKLTLSTTVVVMVNDSKFPVFNNASLPSDNFESISSGVQSEKANYVSDHKVSNKSRDATVQTSLEIPLDRSVDVSGESDTQSSISQYTPIMRRAFPRTNPAYVGTAKPGTADRKYIRRRSVENSAVKSASSGSLNELSNNDSKHFTVEKYLAAGVKNDDLKYVAITERAVDCSLIDRNGNKVNIMGSSSLQGLNTLENEVSLVCQPRSSFIQRHASLSVLSMSSTVATGNDNQSNVEASLYRQKKGRVEEHKLHRRQSSESDVGIFSSSVSNRLSVTVYGSGSQLSMNVDQSIAEHLNQHRIGIRRKAVSVANMLSWTKDPIRKPMFRTSDRVVKKEAVEVFKLIQTYMGDRPCKCAPSLVALEVISKGWSNVQLRDEVYMQLTRQLTDNPHEASFIRGWELLAVSLTMFPPSIRFQSYLEGFITRHVDPSVQLSQEASAKRFALQCHRRFEHITKHGARRGQKSPALDEIELALKSVYSPSMFGSTLNDIMHLQAERYPKRRLPWIQTVLSEAILRLNGHRMEGIFRLSGDIDEVNALKTRCEQWIEPTSCTDAHTPASLLKLWYRQLCDPIIPDNLYDKCVESGGDAESSVRLVHQLPPFNRLVFSYLIRFLQEFVTKENIVATKMDASNIAMIWAPNCLRCPSDDPTVIIDNARKEMMFMRNVIQNLDTGFIKGVY